MRLRRLAIALLTGTAITAAFGVDGRVMAEDVSINLDALGPEPAKKPAKPQASDAVKSEVVPDPAPMRIAPEKPAQPKLSPKPAAPVSAAPIPVAAKPTATGEIDFITKTKRAQGIPAEAPAETSVEPKTAPIAEPTKPKFATPPVMATPIPDDPEPAKLPRAPKLATPALPPPLATAPVSAPAPMALPAAPKRKEQPATVVVNTGGLDADPHSNGKPKGTPLTSIQPDGALFVPKNVDALPQPVSTPPSDLTLPAELDGDDEPKPLTIPPSLPDAPAAPAQTPQPTAKAAPPSTQTIAAATPAKPAAQPAAPSRASVLAGHATAVELMFDPGQDKLTPDAQSALDQIAEPLKSTGLRVQLAAYSGPPGNNSSDARRLSLKRALAVRDYLGTRGVPKLTVNIAAFGGAPQGQTDRVDLMVRTDQVGRLSAGQ